MSETRLNPCLFLLLFLPIIMQAQDTPEKSPAELKNLLRKSKPDTNRVKLLLELGSYYLYKPGEEKADLDSALVFCQAAKTFSEAIHSKKWISESSWLTILCYFEAKQPHQGEKTFLAIVEDYQKSGDKVQEAAAWMKMGDLVSRNESTYEAVIRCYEHAISLYQQLGNSYKEKEIYARKEIADIHLNQGKLDESEKELLDVIEQYKAIGFKNLHYTYDLLSAINIMKGNYNWALLFELETVKSMMATGDSTFAFTFYNRLGSIYWTLGQIENSIQWYKKGVAKSKNIPFDLVGYIVDGMIQLGKPAEALAFIQDALKKQTPTSAYEKSHVAGALGNCYHALGQDNLAEKYYLEMIQQEKRIQRQNNYTSLVNLTIAEFYVNNHRYHTAMPYLHKIFMLPAGIMSLKRLKDAYFLLFKVDSAAGNYLSAIQYFQVHKALNDSIFNETKSRQIEELQIQYETEQKEKDIQLLQNESALQKSKLQQANLTKNITFGGITLLLIIVSLLYNRYRLKQRTNRQLEIQQIEINQTNKSLQNLLEEKEWLLREIHHRVKNNLQIVMSLLNTQSAYLESGVALSAIRDSQHRIRSISLIHQKLYQSNNVALINMPAYIQELVDYLQDSFDTGYRIHFEVDIEPIELDVTQAVPLGLILNEAISNAIKYAFPAGSKGEINITLQQIEEDQFQLDITDNGIGLAADFDMSKCKSLGMSLMKGLSKQLNGSFKIKSDHGLTIQITFTEEQIVKMDAKSAKEAVAV